MTLTQTLMPGQVAGVVGMAGLAGVAGVAGVAGMAGMAGLRQLQEKRRMVLALMAGAAVKLRRHVIHNR